MLGLAACSVAGIHPLADVYALCEQWLTACQNTDGGWLFYWIYSVERAGAFSGVEKIGDKSWYAAGTGWILANRKPDGSWEADAKNKTSDTICDTCWALLFLKQASRHYVYSLGG